MIFCKALNKEFETKEEMFKELKSNLDLIIDKKKSEFQYSRDKGTAISCKSLNGIKLNDAEKASIEIDDDYYYIVVNSTNILDSHEDLHVDGIWNKSVADNQGKNYLVTDHELEINNVVVRKEHIEMFVATVSFKSLGYPYAGNTQILVYKFRKDRVLIQSVKDWLESGDEIQASVRMRYVTIEFAMDSNDPEFSTERKRYEQYKTRIANIEDFDYVYYFYVIKDAVNQRESSLVVAGSNHVTGNIIENKNTEPSKVEDTQTENKEEKIEPTTVIQKLKSSLLLT